MANRQGLTLLQGLFSLLLTGGVAIAVMSFLLNHQRTAQRRITEIEKEERTQGVGIYLKKQFEGARNFQGVSFRISSTPNLGSSGPGFYVEPDTDFSGAPLTGSDRIHIMVGLPSPRVALSEQYLTPSPLISVRATDPGVTIAEVLPVGTRVLISDIRSGELFRITSPPPALNQANIILNTSSFSNTFVPPGFPEQLQNNYVSGDALYPVEIVTIGLDSGSAELRTAPLGSTSYRTIENVVTSYQVLYNLANDALRCPTVTTEADVYARTHWAILNVHSGMSCYRRIRSIQIQFIVADKIGLYTFLTNN